jgi:hypothetical protein
MKIYLASHYSRKNEVRAAVAELAKLGIEVVSTWHREKVASNSVMHPENGRAWRKNAISDKRELDACTHFVLFSMGPTAKFSRGSHAWENGYAVAAGKRCLVVGERQVIFHYLPGTTVCNTWQSAKRILKGEFNHEQHTNSRTTTSYNFGQYANFPADYDLITRAYDDFADKASRRIATSRQVSRLSRRRGSGTRLVSGVRNNQAGSGASRRALRANARAGVRNRQAK